MAGKPPKEVTDVFNATKRNLELKLAETEAFVAASHGKSFDVVINAIGETSDLIQSFVKEKSKHMDTSLANSNKNVIAMQKSLQGINTTMQKLNGLDKTKELSTVREQILKELQADLEQIKEAA